MTERKGRVGFIVGEVGVKEIKSRSMECSSIVSIAAFGPGDLGSNPGWFTVSNSN